MRTVKLPSDGDAATAAPQSQSSPPAAVSQNAKDTESLVQPAPDTMTTCRSPGSSRLRSIGAGDTGVTDRLRAAAGGGAASGSNTTTATPSGGTPSSDTLCITETEVVPPVTDSVTEVVRSQSAAVISSTPPGGMRHTATTTVSVSVLRSETATSTSCSSPGLRSARSTSGVGTHTAGGSSSAPGTAEMTSWKAISVSVGSPNPMTTPRSGMPSSGTV